MNDSLDMEEMLENLRLASAKMHVWRKSDGVGRPLSIMSTSEIYAGLVWMWNATMPHSERFGGAVIAERAFWWTDESIKESFKHMLTVLKHREDVSVLQREILAIMVSRSVTHTMSKASRDAIIQRIRNGNV